MATKNETAGKTSSALQHYEPFDPAQAEAEAKAHDAAHSGNVFSKWPVGKTVFRILPAMPGGKWFCKVYTHFVDIGTEKKAIFTCPQAHAKRPCKACLTAARMEAKDNPVDQAKAKDYRANEQLYCLALHEGQEERGPIPTVLKPGMFRDILELAKDPKNGGDFTDPSERGYPIIVTRTGTSRTGTEYSVGRGDRYPLSDDPDQAEQWLAMRFPITRFAQVESDEAIDAKLCGKEPPRRSAPADQTKGKTAEDYTGSK